MRGNYIELYEGNVYWFINRYIFIIYRTFYHEIASTYYLTVYYVVISIYYY